MIIFGAEYCFFSIHSPIAQGISKGWMKILYISYDGMTDALGRSQVIPYLLGLSGKGHDIHVVSCEKKQIPPEETTEVKTLFQQHNISWSPLSFSTTPPYISKWLDVLKIKNKARALHKTHQFDIVHCRSYISALAGLELKQKYNVKFVFDMRGFWANERIEGFMWKLSNPLHRFMYNYFKEKEKEFFYHADAVVSLTHNGKGVIRDLFGDNVERKTSVIPCCVDTDFFSRENVSEEELLQLRKNLGIQADDFIISYLGSTGTWYMTDEMLLFFRKLKKRYSNARFLFISGDHPGLILKKARLHQIDEQDIIVARAPRNRVPLYLSLSAVSLFFIRPVFSKKASSPTKQAEIMSMGIPLICNSGVGDTDLIFSDESAGAVLEGFSEREFEKTIEKIDALLALDPDPIREKAVRLFNLRDGVNIYDNIYRQISV